MRSVLLFAAGLFVAFGSVWWVGGMNTSFNTRNLERELKGASTRRAATVDFSQLEGLPAPVKRYFQNVLSDGQGEVMLVKMEQTGELRTDTQTEEWLDFTASETVSPLAPGFVWMAEIAVAPLVHALVVDSYTKGQAKGKVSLQSAFPIEEERDTKELNSGALHRYLAEAVWYPTALLPQAGVQWAPVDDNRALATLKDRGVEVSLEFRFNDRGEVTGIYSPGRWGKFDEGYQKVAWEGHFSDYTKVEGMKVPLYGEVGWYENDKLRLVWKGQIEKFDFVFKQ